MCFTSVFLIGFDRKVVGNMGVVLTRVDFRLIHGQVMTRWLTQTGANEIVTIDTTTSKDPFMVDVFKMAAPKGIRIKVYDVGQAVKAQQNGDFEKGKIIVLFKNVAELKRAIDAGLKLESVQIGGLGGGAGRKAVLNAITLDQKDLDDLLAIQNEGVEVYFQTTPDYPSATLDEIAAKF